MGTAGAGGWASKAGGTQSQYLSQRFAVVPSGDVMTMPLLDKRLEVLRSALREAVGQMDFGVIHQLVGKARFTMEPLQFAALLRRWRRGHRLIQAQACAALNLPADQALISDYERGNAVPQPARMRAILDSIASRPAPPPPPRIRPSPFARTLRKWRTFRRLTLARAATILGCTVPMLCNYEHGRSEPPAHRRATILAIIEN